MDGKRVMLVEDDPAIASLIILYLSHYGIIMTHEENGLTAAQRILEEMPDAVLLDGILPGMNGIDVCRKVRTAYRGPIIMLTSMSEISDQIVALEFGADDYIIKPTDPRIILAHLKACLRRAPLTEEAPKLILLTFGNLTICLASRSVTLNDEPVPMTDSEFDLLWLLASNAGRILSRDEIYEKIRGLDYDGLDRSIDMRISRLRKYLHDDSEHPVRIKTVRAKGYLFSHTEHK